MSVTTTANPIVHTTQSILKDYELHHSGTSSTAPPPNATPAPPATVRNPPDWDTTHRRVPPYRPINRELDQSERRVYTNAAHRTFIGVMFTGVLIEATAAKWWGATGGRINGDIFKYRIGGEY